MVHGVYVKSRPKARWHLFSVKLSAESALNDVNTVLQQAKLEGNDMAEAKIQVFETLFYIPESLQEVKDQKLMYS